MDTILETIVARKKIEVSERKNQRPLSELTTVIETQTMVRPFAAALDRRIQAGSPAVIAESKRASPSRGVIRNDYDPATIAQAYAQAGAACISVLTDRDFFQGDDSHLMLARQQMALPVLRKDFMIDPYQIYESRAMGADCILLIVAILADTQLQDLYSLTRELGMDALVEVHDSSELEQAMKLPEAVLGINNRNLHTFKTDVRHTIAMLPAVEPGRHVVSESGIHDPEDVQRLWEAGVHAFLVGEAFMKEPNPGEALAHLFNDYGEHGGNE